MPAPYPPSMSALPSPAGFRQSSPAHLFTSESKHQLPQDAPDINPYPLSSQITPSTTNRKKHICNICAKAFTTSGHLSRHARIHTGERNHKCPFPGCDTRCSRQDNLQQHYRIHLTPGSRRNSTSARSQVLSGIKKQVKVPPTREASLDSPPLTPPALEQAFVPRVYSASEPSPPLSALPCPSAQEYLEQQDYQDATAPSRYFDPRGPPCRPVDASRPSVPEQLLLNPPCPSAAMGGLRPDSCDNTSGTEHGSYSPQNHIFVPPSGGLLMTGSHAINGMSNPFSIYGAYAPPTHPPPNQVPSTQSSDVSIHANVSLVEPQPQSDLRSTQAQSLRTVIATNPPHLSPVPSSNSPSPVSSLSISSHSSDHSPLLYQKPNFPIPPANGVTYGLPGPPQSTQLQAPATERYHPSQLISEIYNRVNPTASWQSSISDARRNPAVHGEGAEFVL
ncbi:hypothetical protein BGW80DRAFT_1455977 [Lactifluus volemus]|nr:hypothetical protein BGW80DRAFT_1455977 [Lactifluus volemus]